MHRQIESIMNKRMDRREFLAHLGFAFLALIGISNLLQSLRGYSSAKPKPRRKLASHGFGATKFGI